jgi:hypothetical protein
VTGPMPTNQNDPQHGHERQPYDPGAPVPSDGTALWDEWSLNDLADGWQVATAVLADGSAAFWLLDPRGQGGGGWCASMAPHELDGALPREVKKRLGLVCGVLSRHTGKPCQQLVRHAGAHCGVHSEGPG